jgi:hypothetical protein
VQLYRVFDWDGVTPGRASGGPLWVARDRQGAGRHDAPSLFGAWYCSRHAVSAVAEALQAWRGHTLEDDDFVRAGGQRKALVSLDVDDALRLIDLDDPSELVRRHVRPSRAASMQRRVTQAMAAAIYREGAAGLAWWSTLNADWAHVTLFFERAIRRVRVAHTPERLSVSLPVVREAADYLGVRLAK